MAVAPLSGPLVIAEPQDSSINDNNKRSFSKDSSMKKKKNKNKYLFKRRVPHPTAAPPDAGNHVLPKGRSKTVEVVYDRKPLPMSSRSSPPLVNSDIPDASLLRTESPCPEITVREQGTGSSEAKSVVNDAKKDKFKKRPWPQDDHDKNGKLVEKKKKKLVTGRIDDTRSEPAITSDPIVLAPKLDQEHLELPNLLHDLTALASDPLYGVERNAASIVRCVFLKFRSAVYKKSLVLPLASDGNGEEACTRKPKEPKEKTPNVKEGSLIKRYSEPSNAGTKRPLPEHPDEGSSAKRIKKLDQHKPMDSEKKAAVSTAADPSARQEPLLPLPPKKFSPTNLVMKFPPNKTLPSIAQLKARFVQFGKLVVNHCRVNWEEHLCRVQFEYKVDALKAYEFARANDIFGNVQVSYSVKEVEVPSEPGRPRLESRPEICSQFRPENGSGSSIARPRPTGPLKSILKKPGEDAGKEGQRVKFNLGVDGSKSVLSAAAVSVGFSDAPLLPPPSVPTLEPTGFARLPSLPSRNPTRVLPPSQATACPITAQTSTIRTFEKRLACPITAQTSTIRTFEKRLPVTTVLSESRLHGQVRWYGDGAKEEEGRKCNGVNNVAHATLNVLLAFNEIMNRLKMLPGFVLYRIDP